ncbi:MAG: ABC transporter permease [Rhodospirillaceae bacterium]
MKDASGANLPPMPRQMGLINWRGLWELYLKEVRRFFKVFMQTVAAPIVTTLIFLAIFTLALGRSVEEVEGFPFAEFLAPGLIMMAMVQNAFANTSSSIIISKIQGNIVDVLMPPISATEMLVAYVMGGVTRGIVVGLAVAVGMMPFVELHVHHFALILFHGFAASMMLSLLGMIGGIWADKFDHIAAVTNFIVTPLSFLSGTFYTVERLPENVQILAHWNPFFYMIDGFRYGFIGHESALPVTGVLVVGLVNVALIALCWKMLSSGYKLKA